MMCHKVGMRRFIVPVLALASLSGCIGRSERTAERPASPPVAVQPSQDTRQCYAALTQAGVRYSPLPDQEFGGGCHAFGSVRIADLGSDVSATNLGPMTCPLASNFAAWVRHAVKPAARQVYGETLVRVETMGTYSCRNIYNARSGPRSQHAFANAVDVSAFVFADGRRVTVLDGWRGDGRDQRFLRLIHQSACRRFGTVLGPDYNAPHANHFHLDMSGQNFCR
ncbi:MAG: extensin family protein [Sphingopyxis sp.]|jgi:hypothetical protein|nr:extensin family protein [Sphingopyxis sp.]